MLARHGIAVDPELTEEIAKTAEALGTVGLDAALLMHQDGASPEEAQAYIERWRLVPAGSGQARGAVRDRPDVARLRGHVLGRPRSVPRVRRR